MTLVIKGFGSPGTVSRDANPLIDGDGGVPAMAAGRGATADNSKEKIVVILNVGVIGTGK